jgi:hypothetical protein
MYILIAYCMSLVLVFAIISATTSSYWSYVVVLCEIELRILTSVQNVERDGSIRKIFLRIREAQKGTDPPDPEHF